MSKLKVACYGTNGHQIVHRLGDHPRAELVAVAEIPPEYVTEHLGETQARGVRFAESLDELIGDPNVEMISLCSPRRDEQYGHIVKCLEGGTHVLAEKPCVMYVEELDGLWDVMERSAAHFREMAGTGEEHVLAAFRRLVESGEMGEVVHVFGMKSYPYHERRPQDRGIDGGLIRQAGIHAVRFIQRATGLRAVRVMGFDTTHGDPGEGELQMAASLSLQMDSGALGVLYLNYLNPPNIGYWGNDQLRIHGTRGMAEAVDGFSRCRVLLHETGERTLDELAATREQQDFLDHYVDFLLDGTPMPTELEDDLWATRTVIRAQQAVDEGRILQV